VENLKMSFEKHFFLSSQAFLGRELPEPMGFSPLKAVIYPVASLGFQGQRNSHKNKDWKKKNFH
jgi:hypothetical protein